MPIGRLPWTVGWNGYMRHPLIDARPARIFTAIAMKLFNIAHSRIRLSRPLRRQHVEPRECRRHDTDGTRLELSEL